MGHSYAQYHRVTQDFNVPLRVRVYTDLCAFANIKDNSDVDMSPLFELRIRFSV